MCYKTRVSWIDGLEAGEVRSDSDTAEGAQALTVLIAFDRVLCS